MFSCDIEFCSSSFSDAEPDGSPTDFDYLLSMPLWSLTLERVQQLQNECAAKQHQLEQLRSVDPKDLWDHDLRALLEGLDQAKAVAHSDLSKTIKAGKLSKQQRDLMQQRRLSQTYTVDLVAPPKKRSAAASTTQDGEKKTTKRKAIERLEIPKDEDVDMSDSDDQEIDFTAVSERSRSRRTRAPVKYFSESDGSSGDDSDNSDRRGSLFEVSDQGSKSTRSKPSNPATTKPAPKLAAAHTSSLKPRFEQSKKVATKKKPIAMSDESDLSSDSLGSSEPDSESDFKPPPRKRAVASSVRAMTKDVTSPAKQKVVDEAKPSFLARVAARRKVVEVEVDDPFSDATPRKRKSDSEVDTAPRKRLTKRQKLE